MDYRTAHLRRLRANKRLQKRLAVVASLAVLASTAALLLVREPTLESNPAMAGVDAAPAGPVIAAAVLHTPLAPARARRVYPFSVVPGGVANRTELVHVLKVDKVVAAHYAAFEVDKAVPVKVARARAVYVSYRKGDKVYWTSKKVALAEGETLLSDGSSEIRTRCGNRISDVPRLPVAADEPSAGTLDTAMDADAEGVQQASAAADGANAAPGAGASHPLSVFPNGAGLAPGARTAAALSMLGLTATAQGGLAPSRGLDSLNALPLLRMASQSSSDSTTNATSGVAASNGSAGASSDTSGSAGSSATVSGPISYATMSGDSGGTPVNPESVGLVYGDGSTTDTAGAPTGMSTPVLGSTTDPIVDAKPGLPALPDALSPQPAKLIPIIKPAADVANVPEPGSPWLCGAALAGMLLPRRRAR